MKTKYINNNILFAHKFKKKLTYFVPEDYMQT